MADALAEVEEAVGLESVTHDDFNALFDGPAVIVGTELSRVARRVKTLVEVSTCSDLECVELEPGEVWRVEGGKWTRLRPS